MTSDLDNTAYLSHFHHFREEFFKVSRVMKLRNSEQRNRLESHIKCEILQLSSTISPPDSNGERLFLATVISPYASISIKLRPPAVVLPQTREQTLYLSPLTLNLLKSGLYFTISREAQPTY